MNLIDRLQPHRPKSIFDVMDAAHFSERNVANHEYIESGRCYEDYFALARYYQPESLLEIGVRLGYSMCALIAGSKRLNYAEGWDIEWYVPNSNSRARDNVARLGRAVNVQLHNLNSQQISELPRRYDFIHVDGDHTYAGAKHDMELARNQCRVMLVDDYDFIPDVRKACDEFVSERASDIHESTVLPTYRGLLVVEFRK